MAAIRPTSGSSDQAQRKMFYQSKRQGPDGWCAAFDGMAIRDLSCSRCMTIRS